MTKFTEEELKNLEWHSQTHPNYLHTLDLEKLIACVREQDKIINAMIEERTAYKGKLYNRIITYIKSNPKKKR
jgi:hypothetical protein